MKYYKLMKYTEYKKYHRIYGKLTRVCLGYVYILESTIVFTKCSPWRWRSYVVTLILKYSGSQYTPVTLQHNRWSNNNIIIVIFSRIPTPNFLPIHNSFPSKK